MAKVRKIPQRMCVGCREMKNKKELIRIVRTPDETILIDPTGKKSGRGAYVCPNAQCFNLAVKGKRIEKALEREIPEDIIQRLRKDLVID
ncbi:MAG: RNase P modulator RnpM [Bacillota bacterium]